MQKEIAEKTYTLITDEGEERACEAISDEACKESPGNFLKNLLNGAMTKLAEQLVSPGTTLPWMMSALGASGGLTGALVPIKDAGSLLPQLLVSARIRAYKIRKWFWVLPAIMQAVCMLGMGFVVLNLTGNTAGLLLLFLLLLLSIASGVASIAFKDVVAKTIPKGKRGQMLAYRSALGGILTLAVGFWLYSDVQDSTDKGIFFLLMLSAAVLWGLAAFIFASILEEKGATDGGITPIRELKNAFRFFKEDNNLRTFIFARGLLMAVPLALPFFILTGKEVVGSEVSNLGIIIIAAGLANVISSPFWGKFADRSSKKLMIVVAFVSTFNILLMTSFSQWHESLQNIFFFSFLLLIQVMMHGGARLSRKTYLIDYAPEKERPLYVSLSNTMIGIFTLIAAGIGGLSAIISTQLMLFIYVALLVLGAILAFRLKEV